MNAELQTAKLDRVPIGPTTAAAATIASTTRRQPRAPIMPHFWSQLFQFGSRFVPLVVSRLFASVIQ